MSAGKGRKNMSEERRLEFLKKICEFKNMTGGALSQKQIAERLELTETDVSNIYNEGIHHGLVHITYIPPSHVELARELGSVLAKKNIGCVLVGRPGESTGHVAARFFEQQARPGKTVVLDGGLTVEDFVREVHLARHFSLKIIPIAADPPSYRISAYELMTRLSAKLPLAHCEKLPHFKGDLLKEDHDRITTAARQADFVFLGAGPFQPGRTALDFVRHLGVDPEHFRRDEDEIAYMCGYCALDANGRNVEIRHQPVSNMPRALEFQDLLSMARSDDKVVALLARDRINWARSPLWSRRE